MNFLRFLLLLSLAIWLGSLIFFPVVAQTSFSVLPSTHDAGMVIRGSLIKLHWNGLVCGVVFLACSLLHNRILLGRARAFAPAHILVVAMLALTVVSQFLIIPKMDYFRISAGDISSLVPNDPIRVQFDSLHAWSVHIEESVLVLGLMVLYAVGRRLSSVRA